MSLKSCLFCHFSAHIWLVFVSTSYFEVNIRHRRVIRSLVDILSPSHSAGFAFREINNTEEEYGGAPA